jgi:hypothetical protein
MWDNLGLALSDLESKGTQTDIKFHPFASTEDGAHTPQMNTLELPAKLQWNLLEKVKDKRFEIATIMQPK